MSHEYEKVNFVYVGLIAFEVCKSSIATAEDRIERNIRIMLEAARELELSSAADGHAYLLVKQETVRAPVAVIFGYVDNAAAYEEIADTLSHALRAGTFRCQAVY